MVNLCNELYVFRDLSYSEAKGPWGSEIGVVSGWKIQHFQVVDDLHR
jgi:hypothetical protein